MGTIIIGSSANKKGITIEPSVVLFNGNNVQRIMSGLITIWEDIKPLVPVMTSNTTPYGKVIYSSAYNTTDYPIYYAFDGNDTTMGAYKNSDGGYIGYEFVNPTCVKRMVCLANGNMAEYVKLQCSNDGSNWVDLTETFQFSESGGSPVTHDVTLDNSEYYKMYRLYQVGKRTGVGGVTTRSLQFYGKQLVGLVPVMTSNTTPSGVASASTETTNGAGVAYAYKAFTGGAPNASTGANFWYSIGTSGEWLEYKFERNLAVKTVKLAVVHTTSGKTIQLKVQAYHNNEWVDISNVETCTSSGTAMTPVYITCTNEIISDRIRLLRTGGTCEYTALGWVQYYG